MPFVFTCPNPKCKQKNYGEKTKPVGLNYRLKITCARCGKKDIYWVVDEQTAALIIEQEKVKREDITVGVEESPIGYFEPQTADSSDAAILTAMVPFATLSAPFSQGTRHAKFTPELTDLAEGQCEGQSLHWIRRVLHGGQETYKVVTVKENVSRSDQTLVEHQEKQSRQGAITHRLVDQEKDAPRNEGQKAILKLVHDKRLQAGFKHVGGVNWQFSADQRREWDALAELQRTELEKYDARGHYVNNWDQLAKDIDRALAEAKLASKKRPYSNIVAFKCSNRIPYDSVAAFVDKALKDVEFKADTCVLISVGLTKGVGGAGGSISGHAIAAHFKSATACYLFDPNIGVFVCDSPAKLIGAMETLIGKVWTQNLKWNLDGKYGFTFFRLKEGVVVKQSKEVLYTASPPATAKENAAAGEVIPSGLAKKTEASSSSPKPANAGLSGPKKVGSASVAELRKKFGGN